MNNLLEKEAGKKVPTPLKTFNQNPKNYNCKPEYMDKLMMELKSLIKKKKHDSCMINLNASCENLDPKVRPTSVQTLIRPQLTNPKIFWSKSEDEDISSDQKYKRVRNDCMEEKVIMNIFKPIRRDLSPDVRKFKTLKVGNRKIRLEGREDEKSIHESLKIQKIKRRTSLPFLWVDKEKNEVEQNTEKMKTYDVSYYTSMARKQAQEGSSDYYSYFHRNATKYNCLIKSASDECVYSEKEEVKRKHGNGKESEVTRLSVTEPSSPFASDCSVELTRRLEKYSDSDSESSRSEKVTIDMKKSKSFSEENNSCRYYKLNKLNVAEIRKPSISSASSAEYASRSRSLRRQYKNKRKPAENAFLRTPQTHWYLEQMKQQIPLGDKDAERSKKEEKNSKMGNCSQKRSQSWNREVKKKEEFEKISPDVLQHLINVVMQKNQTKDFEEETKELFAKSLPRQLKHNCTKNFKEETRKKDGVVGNVLGSEIKIKSKSEGEGTERRRRKKKSEEKKIENLASGSRDKKRERRVETGLDKRIGRRKKLEEECVIEIEDKKLWIEICKAMEKVDGKGKMKKCG